MGWNISWLFWGGAAFLLTAVNFIRALLRKHKGWETLLFASLACGLMTVLLEYRMVAQWLHWGEWAAIENAVPFLSNTLSTAVFIGLLWNLLVLILHLHRRNR